MSIVVLGASGRLGRMARQFWKGQAVWLGRSVSELPEGGRALIDLRGIVPGRGDLALNTTLAHQALEAAHRLGYARVFLASSAAVYGQASGPLTPDVAAPVSDYGHAKLAMEHLATAHPQPSTVLRIGNVAGADAILAAWRPGFAVDRFPDGSTPRRSYIGPQTFSRVLQHLASYRELPHILNLAAPGSIAFQDLLDAAALKWSPRPADPTAIADVTLDTTPLEALFDFAPEDSTAPGIVAQWRRMKDGT